MDPRMYPSGSDSWPDAAVQHLLDGFSRANIAAAASYTRLTNGAQQLLAAVNFPRVVVINVKVATAFAVGDGAAPVFDFGETGTVEKFKADLNTGAAGADLTYSGVLAAGKALIITATAATGATSTGAIDVVALSFPT